MATPYETIFNRFGQKINDFNLVELDDYSLDQMLKDWLRSAVVRSRTTSDLSRDDENEVFVNDLNDLDVELLAMGMVISWLDQTLNSTELTLQFVSGKEEKFFSQANHIAELRALREDTVREMQKLHTYNTYTNNSYFD